MTSRKRLRDSGVSNGDIPARQTLHKPSRQNSSNSIGHRDDICPALTATRETCTGPAPFSHEDVCQRLRDSIDYSVRITIEMAENDRAPRPVRVYADGIYDMFHSGHARQLMQAKKHFPNSYLIVGVSNDEMTHSRKGRTVMNEVERYEAIRHCRYVDEVVADPPWELDDEFLEQNKIDFVAHDDLPYGAGDQDDIYKWLKDKGMFITTERTEGISTTDVIARILRDYDVYIRRNLSRGYSAKELNVGYMKEKRLIFQEKVDALKEKLATKKTSVIDKGQEMIDRWEEKSRDLIGSFLDLFGRDGRINQWLNEGRMKMARAISPPNAEQWEDDSSSSQSRSPTSSPPAKRREAREESLSYEDL